MNIDRYRFIHRASALTMVLYVVIGAVCAAGALSIVGLLVRAAG